MWGGGAWGGSRISVADRDGGRLSRMEEEVREEPGPTA